MYSPDTLKRLNDKEVEKYRKQVAKGNLTCDFCDNKAEYTIPVYNPADAVRTPPVKGAYVVYHICEECRDKGYHEEENFYCDNCGEFFIRNHSWDMLAVVTENGIYCQACAAEMIEPVPLSQILDDLRQGKTDHWKRINNIPGREEVWSGEYSCYSDFPGHTNMEEMASEIEKTIIEKGYALDDTFIPAVTQGYQFSVVLEIFK